MLKRLYVIVLLLGVHYCASCQSNLESYLKGSSKITCHQMPEQNNMLLRQKYINNLEKGQALKFAESFEVNFNPSKNGTWESITEARSMWRLRIQSRGALSLNLGFESFFLPKTASFYVVDSKEELVLGPLTKNDNEDHLQYWTPAITSDELMLVVEIDNDEKEDLQLSITKVNHDFIGINELQSGSCNLDVVCGISNGFPEVEAYRDIIRSVGMYTISGTDICSGFLINNTGQDCRPFFITAFHCGVVASNAPSVVTYWKYENSTCRVPGSSASGGFGDGQRTIYNSGSTLRASYSNTDFTLLEFDDEIPLEAEAFLAGFDVSDQLAEKSICIHHPNLEEKRISFENDPVHVGTWQGDEAMIPSGDHLIVNDWDLGTTEGGSSGAPLFNEEGKAIGQLHGGEASCSNNAYDSYGWLHKSWEGGGEPTNSLKPWLDPLALGIEVLDGKECSFALNLENVYAEICRDQAFFMNSITVSESFNGPVSLSALNVPSNLSISFGSTIINPGETSSISIDNLDDLEAGFYSIIFEASDGSNASTINFQFSLYDALPEIPSLSLPLNAAGQIKISPQFVWESDEFISTYHFRLAEDLNFNNVLFESADLNKNTIQLDFDLMAQQTYYWQVKGFNSCGESNWSDSFSFTVENIECTLQSSADVPIAIDSESPNVIFSELIFNGGGLVSSLTLENVRGNHSFIGDLIMSLISPNGTEVVLVDENCGPNEDFDLSFDDNALSNVPCPYDDGGTYLPAQSLSAFTGQEANGKWVLRIEDVASLDGGSLENWDLKICVNPESDCTVRLINPVESFCNNEFFDFEFKIGQGFESISSAVFQIQPSQGTVPTGFGKIISQTQEAIIYRVNENLDASVGSYDGSFFLTDSSGKQDDLTFSFYIDPLPNQVLLLEPSNEEDKVQNDLEFSWEIDALADSYRVIVSKESDFTDLFINETVQINKYASNVNFEENTKYYWKVYAINECAEIESNFFTFTTDFFNSTTNKQATAFQLYPNPAKDFIKIAFEEFYIGLLEVSVFSSNGQLVAKKSISYKGDQYELNVIDLPTGLYLVKLETQKDTYRGMFLIQK